MLPGCPVCGGVSWSARTVLFKDLTLITFVFPEPTGFATETNPVPTPILFSGLNATNWLRITFKLVLMPTENVNLLWSMDNLWPALWNVVIPLCLKTLYLFNVVSICKTLTFSSLSPITNQSPTAMSSSLFFPPTTSVNFINVESPVSCILLIPTDKKEVIEATPIVLGPSRNLISPVPIPDILTKSLFCKPWHVDAIPTPNSFLKSNAIWSTVVVL